jgi:hypothetical protein
MRAGLMLIAPTLGSVAFQMTVDAGYLKGYEWLIPWVWGASVALWALWFMTHEKMGSQWLRELHFRVGKGIWPLRVLLSLIVFFAVSFGFAYLFPPRQQTVSAAQSQPGQQNTQAGNNNNAGNISQSGDHNIAVVGSNAKVGNTYNYITGTKTIGWLRPGREATPRTNCQFGTPLPSDLIFFVGSSVARISKDIHYPFNVVTINDHPILRVDKDLQGRIAISGEVFDDKDNAIVVIRNNKFTASEKNTFSIDSTVSTLEVTVEHLNEPVLSVNYMNPKVVKVTGHFHYKGTDVLVKEDEIVTNPGNNRLADACAAYSGISAFSF